MSKKQSKKRSNATALAPRATSSTTTGIDYYPKTAEAFEVLIMAFVEAEGVIRVARNVSRRIDLAKQMGAAPGYVRKPDSDDSPDQAAMLSQMREELPTGLRELNQAVDTYFDTEARFRAQVERAKAAIDAAAFELDSLQTPPLRRTTIAIRRALRNLSGSVPYPMTSGWAAAAEPAVLEGIGVTARRVSFWIEELRLLVRPRHTMPLAQPHGESDTSRRAPVGAASVTPKASQTRNTRTHQLSRDAHRLKLANSDRLDVLAETLTPLHMMILRALKEYVACTPDDVASKQALCDNVMQGRLATSLTKPLHHLKRLDLVGSTSGRSGGYWIKPKGLAVIQHRDEPHSRHSAADKQRAQDGQREKADSK